MLALSHSGKRGLCLLENTRCACWGDKEGIWTACCQVGTSASVFKIKYNVFLDTFILKIYFLILKISNLLGALKDILPKTEALIGTA